MDPQSARACLAGSRTRRGAVLLPIAHVKHGSAPAGMAFSVHAVAFLHRDFKSAHMATRWRWLLGVVPLYTEAGHCPMSERCLR